MARLSHVLRRASRNGSSVAAAVPVRRREAGYGEPMARILHAAQRAAGELAA